MTRHTLTGSGVDAELTRLLITQGEGGSPEAVSKRLGFSERIIRHTRVRFARDPETGYPSPPPLPASQLADSDLPVFA